MSETSKSLSNKTKKLKPLMTTSSEALGGKVMPQAIPLEEVILGALMIDRDAMSDIINILMPESFYLTAHQHIFEAMQLLYNNSHPVDLLTVKDQLSKSDKLDEIGGVVYLVDLTNKVASAANIEYHARIVAQKHIQRELIRVSTSTINKAFDETKDVFELLDEAEQGLFDVTQNNLTKSYSALKDLVVKAKQNLEELSKQDIDVTGIHSGFTDLDRITNGWQKSDLIIIAARPGMGKTAFTLNLALNAAKNYGNKIAFFSLEMSSLQLAHRMISMEAEVNSHKLRSGQLEDDEWRRINDTVERLNEVNVFIDDTPGLPIFELRAKARRLVMQQNIEMLIVDYLQLMTGGADKSGGNRQEEISKISRSLKSLAKELDIPVIALSQLSRAVEQRGGDKRPMLSDLRESGAIEQDADMVMFLYRPGYYGVEEDTMEKNLTEVIIEKHRNGKTDTIDLKFIPEYVKFDNMDAESFSSITSDEFYGGGNDEIITVTSRINNEDETPF